MKIERRSNMASKFSQAGTNQELSGAYGVIFFLGIINILIGLLVEMFQIEFLKEMGIGIGSIILGIFYLVLGLFVWRGSKIALGIAIALYAIDGILTFGMVAQQGGTPPIGGIIFRIYLISRMIKGFGGIDTVKESNRWPSERKNMRE